MDKLDTLKRSEIIDFIGEVFFSEMLDFFKEDKHKKFWVKCKGINSRAFSKDVVNLTNRGYVVDEDIKEAIFIHISRNSIYHQLPESFFHPLVISGPTMSHAEVVEAIRENRKSEEDNIRFFMPFDTMLFEKRVHLTDRYLNIFTEENSKKVLFNLARKIIDKDIPFSKEQYYKLFLNLCNSEAYKENLENLEHLLKQIMGYKVALKYVQHVHNTSPFQTLGTATLGHTFGLEGETISEFDDVSATMIVEDAINYKTIVNNMNVIKMILEFFVFPNREIMLKFQTKAASTITLGQNYLGYNTILITS
jgi:hypothetical protein